MDKNTILLVDDEESERVTLQGVLSHGGYQVCAAANSSDAISRLRDNDLALLVIDTGIGRNDALQVLAEAKSIDPQISVIAIADCQHWELALDALRHGADDYMLKPHTAAEFFFRITKCLEMRQVSARLRCMEQQLQEERRMRLQIQETVSSNERRLRLVLDATSDGVWDRNLITNEVYYGENWARILGYTLDEVKCRNLSWEGLLHSDDKVEVMARIRDHFEGRTERYVAEFRMRNKAGGWQWILARGKVVEWNEDGRPTRFVGTHTDISDRKRYENALFRSFEKIKLFAYSVAHDFKNPAVTICGLTKLLNKQYRHILDEKGRAYCNQILNSSEQLRAFVEKVNGYISAKEKAVVIERVLLKKIVGLIHEEFSGQLEQRHIEWYEPEILPMISADRISILRALRNLVDNALKHGGQDLSEIEIGYRASLEFHIVYVRDNGAGLKQEETGAIFKPFRRGKDSAGIEGSGLGLALVKEIAELHNGRIYVRHSQNRGITFYLAISKSLSLSAEDFSDAATERQMMEAR